MVAHRFVLASGFVQCDRSWVVGGVCGAPLTVDTDFGIHYCRILKLLSLVGVECPCTPPNLQLTQVSS
ncbi:hypothetical protein [Microseira wollei]|uniref:hypothetical protein n=1 Tax=Microseira wollei TaxID=467598 RepID=UPI001CFC7BE1|nr:hypothetical protein [Microseira wollei]